MSAQAELNQRLKMNATGREQDWEFELSDHQRIGEFIELWTQVSQSPPLKRSLAALLLASYEDYLYTNPVEDVFGNQLSILFRDHQHIDDILEYWSLTDEADSSDWFLATPMIRKVRLSFLM